jgi:hypothetical protein
VALGEGEALPNLGSEVHCLETKKEQEKKEKIISGDYAP